MGNTIVIAGKSGSGKTTSLLPNKAIGMKGLDPKETWIVQGTRKDLPAPGWKKLYKTGKMSEGANLFYVKDYTALMKLFDLVNTKYLHVKNLVIDDSNYIMAAPVFAEKKLEYDDWKDLARDAYKAFKKQFRDDLNVIWITHTDEVENKEQMKSIGKMLQNYIYLDGLFTTILYAKPKKKGRGTEYLFVTNDGITSTAKSPAGMFPLVIPNDICFVLDRINKYHEGILVDESGKEIV